MAVFLAEPFDDETFQSCVFRYIKNMRVSDRPNLIRQLVGTSRLPAGIVSRLNYIERQTFGSWGRTAQDIAEQLTLYPYLATFMNQEERAGLLESMSREEDVRSLKASGRSASSYRYCDMCFSEDRAARRDEYWRRSHQVPGVLVCHQHGTLLSHLPIQIHRAWDCDPERRHRLGKKIELSLSDSQAKYCLALARKSRTLLFPGQTKDRAASLVQWREVALRAGYRRGRRFVNVPQLRTAFAEFYGEELLGVVGEMFEKGKSSYDISASFRGLGFTSVHSFLRWEVFFEELEKTPFDADWPYCPNPYAGHRPPKLADRASKHGDSWRAMCRCGTYFKYSHVEGGWPMNVKLLAGGPTYHREAERLAAMGVSKGKIASMMGVTETTIYFWLRGLSGRRGAKSDKDVRAIELRYRNALKEHGTPGKVNRADRALYRDVLNYARHLLLTDDVLT